MADNYLARADLQARVGGAAVYLELTDDDGNEQVDSGVEEFLMDQVDAIVDGYARTGGYTVPLADTDVETIKPYLLDIANYKAKTRGARVASADDLQLYKDALARLEEVASGIYKFPSFEAAAPIPHFGFDTPQQNISNGPPQIFTRSTLRNW